MKERKTTMNKKQIQMIKKVENKKGINNKVWSCVAEICKSGYDLNTYGLVMANRRHWGRLLELRKPAKVLSTIFDMIKYDNASESQIVDFLKSNVKEVA
tara:strand:- start:47 stop:343 length:297 start_codon:yes stop_codon:yes gene_type:complete